MLGPEELIRRYPEAGRHGAQLDARLPPDGGARRDRARLRPGPVEPRPRTSSSWRRSPASAARRSAGPARRRAQPAGAAAGAAGRGGRSAAHGRSTTARRWARWRTSPSRGWPTAASSTSSSRAACTSWRPCTCGRRSVAEVRDSSSATRPTRSIREAPSARCCAPATPTLVPDVDDEFLDRITRGARASSGPIRALGMRSLIIVPLVARGRTLGAITLIQDVSDRRYDDQDLATAQEPGRPGGAGDRQRPPAPGPDRDRPRASARLLPDRGAADRRDRHLAARYLAAGEGIEVGGDFYDVWRDRR